jgi:Spy/CpxP family protein refolding chaperone
MTRSRIIILTTAVLGLGTLLVGGAAATHAAGRALRGEGGEHERIIRAIVDAKLDIVSEKLGLDAAQRARVDKVRDDLVAAFEAGRGQRKARHQEFLQEFQKDALSRETLERLGQERHKQMESMKDALMDAILEIHQTLTPAQRQQLASLIEERVGRHGLR